MICIDRDRSVSCASPSPSFNNTSGGGPLTSASTLVGDENADPFSSQAKHSRAEFPPFDTMGTIHVQRSTPNTFTRRPNSSSGVSSTDAKNGAVNIQPPPMHRMHTTPSSSPTRPRVSIPSPHYNPSHPSPRFNPHGPHSRSTSPGGDSLAALGARSGGGGGVPSRPTSVMGNPNISRPTSPSPLRQLPSPRSPTLSARSSLPHNHHNQQTPRPNARPISISRSRSNSASRSGSGEAPGSSPLAESILRSRLESQLGACSSCDVHMHQPQAQQQRALQPSMHMQMQMNGYYPQHSPLSPLSPNEWDRQPARHEQSQDRRRSSSSSHSQSQSPPPSESFSASSSASTSSSSISLPPHFNDPRPHSRPSSARLSHVHAEEHGPIITPPPSPPFDARTASALLRSREGYVSFADVQGLGDMRIDGGDDDNDGEEEDESEGRGKRWWGLLWRG